MAPLCTGWPASRQAPTPRPTWTTSAKPARFVPHPREGVIATKDEVHSAVKTGDPWLLDVRRDSEFTCEEKRAAHYSITRTSVS